MGAAAVQECLEPQRVDREDDDLDGDGRLGLLGTIVDSNKEG